MADQATSPRREYLSEVWKHARQHRAMGMLVFLFTAYSIFTTLSTFIDFGPLSLKLPTLPLTWAAIIALIAIAFIAIEGGYRLRQAEQAKHLSDAKKSAEENIAPVSGPKLIMRRVYLKPGADIPSANAPHSNPWTVQYVIANTGGRPAHLKTSFAVRTFKELPGTLPYVEPTEIGDPLEASEEREFSADIDDELAYLFRSHGIKASHMRHQRSSSMYFFGYAKYKDGLGIMGGKLGVLRHYNLEAGRFDTISDPQYEFCETSENITDRRLEISSSTTLRFDDVIPGAYVFLVEIQNTEIRFENTARNVTAGITFQPIKGEVLKGEGAWKHSCPGSCDKWTRQIGIPMGQAACLPLFYYFQNSRPFKYYQLDARKLIINHHGLLTGTKDFDMLTFGDWSIQIKLIGDNVEKECCLKVNLSPDQGPRLIS